MAEEEILQPAAPEKKKKGGGGGGISMVQVVIIAVLLIVVTAVIVVVIGGKVKGVQDDLSTKVSDVQTRLNTGTIINASQRNKLEDCEAIVPLLDAGKSLIVNLADGKSYLSTTISICLAGPEEYKSEKYKTVEDAFAAEKDKVIYVSNEFLSTLTKADLFNEMPAAPVKAEDDSGMTFGDESSNEGFSKKMDIIRGKLLRVIRDERGIKFVKDIYFTSFLVQ